MMWAVGFQKSFINYLAAGKKMDIGSPLRLEKARGNIHLPCKGLFSIGEMFPDEIMGPRAHSALQWLKEHFYGGCSARAVM